jgi:hypothetical protein
MAIPRPSVTKLWILLALRKAESSHGAGFAGPLEHGDVAAGKTLAEAGFVTLSRRPAPGLGTQVELTVEGRAEVDELVNAAGR